MRLEIQASSESDHRLLEFTVMHAFLTLVARAQDSSVCHIAVHCAYVTANTTKHIRFVEHFRGLHHFVCREPSLNMMTLANIIVPHLKNSCLLNLYI